MVQGESSEARGARHRPRGAPRTAQLAAPVLEERPVPRGVLLVVALGWGLWLVVLGALLLDVTPVAGTLAALLGLLSWGGALQLVLRGE